MLKNISFRTKVTVMLLSLSLLSVLILMFAIYGNGKKGMTENIFKHLTSLRTSKQYQIEDYFNHTLSLVEILGDNPTIMEATKAFKSGFRNITEEAFQIDCKDSLSIYYQDYIAKLSKNLDINSDIDMYYPYSTRACYLQYEYIIDNPYDIGEKNDFIDANDGSQYNEAHKKYHNYLNELLEEIGFYDIFLIDLETGDIVYSVFKEADFATNLYAGPYSQSNLANLVKSLNENRDIRKPTLVDFKNYRPSYGAPASFIGVPLTQGSEVIGALVVQVSQDEINRVMTSDRNWDIVGMGKTGETYLVGKDFKMRSVSRFFLEDTLNFKSELMDIGLKEKKIGVMYNIGTTILNLQVQTEATQEALKGQSATKIVDDYRGVPVLSSYSPINIAGLEWAILAEMDQYEAMSVLRTFKRNIIITLALLLFILTFLSSWVAGFLVAPVERLKSAFKQMTDGKYDKIEIRGSNEFTLLAQQFNGLSKKIESNNDQIEFVKKENEKLLYSFIPKMIAKRIQSGETDIVEVHQNVSLIIIDIDDFTDLTEILTESEAVEKLNELIDAFDSAALNHHVEKIRTQGDNYFASCGLFTPRMDHCKRIVDYALELQQILESFNTRNKLELSLLIGINSGPVTAAVVGKENFNFDVLGETVDNLLEIRDLKLENQIIVDSTVYQKTKDFFEFDMLSDHRNFKVTNLKSHI